MTDALISTIDTLTSSLRHALSQVEILAKRVDKLEIGHFGPDEPEELVTQPTQGTKRNRLE